MENLTTLVAVMGFLTVMLVFLFGNVLTLVLWEWVKLQKKMYEEAKAERDEMRRKAEEHHIRALRRHAENMTASQPRDISQEMHDEYVRRSVPNH